jgi:hypothetical protein
MLTLLSLFGVELAVGGAGGLLLAFIKNPTASSILKSAGRHLFKKIALQDYTPAEREIAKKRSDELKKLPLNAQASAIVHGFR